MREFKIYPIKLRRHKKKNKQTNKQKKTKFTYVCVNLISQPSLASEIELKKVNKSINTGKVSFGLYCNLIFFPRKLHHSCTVVFQN